MFLYAYISCRFKLRHLGVKRKGVWKNHRTFLINIHQYVKFQESVFFLKKDVWIHEMLNPYEELFVWWQNEKNLHLLWVFVAPPYIKLQLHIFITIFVHWRIRAFLRRKLYADVMNVALAWRLIANVMRGRETTYSEISLVGSCFSGPEFPCHCWVARVGLKACQRVAVSARAMLSCSKPSKGNPTEYSEWILALTRSRCSLNLNVACFFATLRRPLCYAS